MPRWRSSRRLRSRLPDLVTSASSMRAMRRDFLKNHDFTVDDGTLVVLERFQLIEALGQADR